MVVQILFVQCHDRQQAVQVEFPMLSSVGNPTCFANALMAAAVPGLVKPFSRKDV